MVFDALKRKSTFISTLSIVKMVILFLKSFERIIQADTRNKDQIFDFSK